LFSASDQVVRVIVYVAEEHGPAAKPVDAQTAECSSDHILHDLRRESVLLLDVANSGSEILIVWIDDFPARVAAYGEEARVVQIYGGGGGCHGVGGDEMGWAKEY
jgi:hypothetical protein